MTTWFPRGVVLAALMVFLRLVQGALINTSPTKAGLISVVLVLLFGVAPAIWGFIDGTADARANPDPDRRRDLAMRWLVAGLFAGVVSGAVTWLISLFYRNVYVDGLPAEVTAIGAFTALMVFLPAIIASSVGRHLVDRKRPPRTRQREGEFDVFDAAREEGYEEPTEQVAVSGRRTENWLRDSREAVREVHETVQQRKYDLNRTTPDDD